MIGVPLAMGDTPESCWTASLCHVVYLAEGKDRPLLVLMREFFFEGTFPVNTILGIFFC